MTLLNLPFLDQGKIRQQAVDYSFTRPENHPLVIWTSLLPKTKRQELELICGLLDYPFQELTGYTPLELDRQMEQVWEEEQTLSILLIGDYREFPPMKFKTQYGVHFSDYIYADIGNEGEADVGIGRVFGSINTIKKHLQFKIGDSNKAVLFESDPERSSTAIEAIKSLGFDLKIIDKYSQDRDKSKLENAELILQVSDGVINERIHGTALKWASHKQTIMDYRDFENLNFKNYPVIFSEACSTASFGPLLAAALKSGAMYFGATSLSMNNPKEFSNWRSCPYADGVKIGMLDIMDEVQTMGQVVQVINRELYNSLSKENKQLLKSAIHGADKGEDITSPEVSTLLQFNLFGNPERPVTVGINPDYDAGVIHFDT